MPEKSFARVQSISPPQRSNYKFWFIMNQNFYSSLKDWQVLFWLHGLAMAFHKDTDWDEREKGRELYYSYCNSAFGSICIYVDFIYTEVTF